MSLIGVGIDLCDMRRIERMLARFGARFADRVFTPQERAWAEKRCGQARIGTYAKRWAAKEACAKALGTGFAHGVTHAQIGVENLPGGQPVLCLTGDAAQKLAEMTPPGSTARLVLSLTDEAPYAFAQVFISAVPA